MQFSTLEQMYKCYTEAKSVVLVFTSKSVDSLIKILENGIISLKEII